MNVYNELKLKLEKFGKAPIDVSYGRICLKENFERKIFDYKFKDSKEFIDILYKLKNKKYSYDNGFGIQELYGFVIFNDGSWLERQEYDGSEWWVYKKTPTKKDIFEKNLC
jgi:hypothetical protein